MLRKYLILVMIMAGYICSIRLDAEPTQNLDKVAFWNAVVHSAQIKANPEFRRHAESQYQRVQTLERGSRPVASQAAQGIGLSENWMDKARAFKDRYLSPAKEEPKAHTAKKEKPKTKKVEHKKDHKKKKHHSEKKS